MEKIKIKIKMIWMRNQMQVKVFLRSLKQIIMR